jgi:capsular exopolysaccharide synthesis family protein
LFAADQQQSWNGAREAFNAMHAKLSFTSSPESHRTLVVTSPLPGDGKTTVAVNLAGTVARQGHKVLLIDADIRRGIVHSVFRLPRSPGLIDVLSDASDVGGALRAVRVANGRPLHVLTRGTPNDDPAQVLGPARIRAFVERMAFEFDWVIIDSPPLNVVADAALLGATGAGVILVARAGVTSGAALTYAAEQLRSIRATVVGTVLNGIGKREASYDSAYRYYEYAGGYGAPLGASWSGQVADGRG